MKNRKTALIVISALVVVVGLLVIISQPYPPSIPHFDKALYNQLTPTGIQTFEISEKDLAQVSLILKSTNRDSFPKKWAYLGFLELSENGITVSTITIFTNTNGLGPIQISDEYYLGYDQEAFQSILSRSTSMSHPISEQQSNENSFKFEARQNR